MARAARTVLAVVAALGAFVLAPSGASAAIVGTTSVSIAPSVTIGQTGVIATITITNANTSSDDETTNTLCSFEAGPPCFGEGTTLLPSCGGLVAPDCDLLAKADPDVFSAPATVDGKAGSSCASTTFTISPPDPQTGKLTLLPDEVVTLGGTINPPSSCIIEVPLTVVGMPDIDASAEDAGLQTDLVAFSKQTDGSMVSATFGDSSTTVNKATTSIATLASPGVAVGGGTLTDTATVTGRVLPVPGATVTFTLFGPDGIPCQPPAAFEPPPVPIADDGTATSPPFTPTQAGTYIWVASYSGDANNLPANGGCGDAGETVVVSPPVVIPPMPPPPPPPLATPSIGVAASPGVMVGGQVTATATVAGRRDPLAGSTLLFRAYGPEGTGCLDPPTFSATAPVGASGVVTSPPFTPPVAGIYRWTAAYSGDANNLAAGTACNAPGSTVTVAPLPAQILSSGFESGPRVGEQSFLEIAAYDPTRPITGVEVRFGEPRGLSGISACRILGFGIAASPVRLRLPFIFRRAGRHRITIIILSGGCDSRLHTQTSTINVDVDASGSATRAFWAAGAAAQPGARAAQAKCSNTLLRPKAAAASRLKVAAAILCLVNAERSKKGLKKLKRSRVLATIARGHSKDMYKRRYFQHRGPGGPSFQKRLARTRYRGSSASENIGYGARFNAKLMVQAWMNSPPHKANILSPRSKFAGVGIAVGIPVTPAKPGSTYTMNFGASLK